MSQFRSTLNSATRWQQSEISSSRENLLSLFRSALNSITRWQRSETSSSGDNSTLNDITCWQHSHQQGKPADVSVQIHTKFHHVLGNDLKLQQRAKPALKSRFEISSHAGDDLKLQQQ